MKLKFLVLLHPIDNLSLTKGIITYHSPHIYDIFMNLKYINELNFGAYNFWEV